MAIALAFDQEQRIAPLFQAIEPVKRHAVALRLIPDQLGVPLARHAIANAQKTAIGALVGDGNRLLAWPVRVLHGLKPERSQKFEGQMFQRRVGLEADSPLRKARLDPKLLRELKRRLSQRGSLEKGFQIEKIAPGVSCRKVAPDAASGVDFEGARMLIGAGRIFGDIFLTLPSPAGKPVRQKRTRRKKRGVRDLFEVQRRRLDFGVKRSVLCVMEHAPRGLRLAWRELFSLPTPAHSSRCPARPWTVRNAGSACPFDRRPGTPRPWRNPQTRSRHWTL